MRLGSPTSSLFYIFALGNELLTLQKRRTRVGVHELSEWNRIIWGRFTILLGPRVLGRYDIRSNKDTSLYLHLRNVFFWVARLSS